EQDDGKNTSVSLEHDRRLLFFRGTGNPYWATSFWAEAIRRRQSTPCANRPMALEQTGLERDPPVSGFYVPAAIACRLHHARRGGCLVPVVGNGARMLEMVHTTSSSNDPVVHLAHAGPPIAGDPNR